VQWLRKAAEQNFSAAQYDLGRCYGEGQGVSQDYAQAVYWYRKAADQGDADAQYSMGWSYEHGAGVLKGSVQAVQWYRMAAGQGYALAEYELGVMYANGEGVPKDAVQAAEWFRRASENGNKDAPGLLAQLTARSDGAMAPSKTFLWHTDPSCCHEEKSTAPNGVSTYSRTVSSANVRLRVSAQVRRDSVRFVLEVNPRIQTKVYALSAANLEIQGKMLKPVDADKRTRSIDRSAAIQGVITALHGAKSTSNVEIQDQQGRSVGTATVTSRDEAATQRQMDGINQQAALERAAYQDLLRDYDALPGKFLGGAVLFEIKLRKPTAAVFRIQIGDTNYAVPFDLVAAR
jgi:hypothetical protein